MIDSSGMSHVHIRGLTFRFTNVYWNLTAAPYWVSHESIDVEPGCVRLLGSGTDIEVTHCTFEHVHKGVRLKAMGRQDAIDQVVVDDNVFSDADSGGVELADSTTYGDVDPPMGRLYEVRVMRNKFDHIGIRPDLFGQGAALAVDYAQTAEVAGNIFDRVCAQGIDVHGAKPSGAATDRPFTRILIHHNKAVDTLLNVDDFGGIETWQGGPAYVYNNISGNPGGYRNWDHVLSPDTEDRFGHAYYLDGAFKNYHFNNIAWGKSKGPAGKLANTSAFQEIISYQNTFFNNTLYNFVRGSRRQEPQAGRVKFLGNIWQSMGLRVFRDADPADTAGRRQRGRRRTPPQPVRDRHRRLRAQRLLRLGGELRRVRALRAVAQDAPVVPGSPGKLQTAGRDRGCHGRAVAPARSGRSRLPTVRQLGGPRPGREGLRAVEPLRDGRRMELLPHPGRSDAYPGRALVHVPLLHGAGRLLQVPHVSAQGRQRHPEGLPERPAGELDHGCPALQRARPVRRPQQRRHQPHGRHGWPEGHRSSAPSAART